MIYVTVKECDSTQEIAIKELNARPDLDAVWARSLSMTKGRGRRGRSWHCLDGNLFLSGAYRIDDLPKQKNPHWPFVSLIMAHSLAKSLEALGYWKDSFLIKWPNDLWGKDPVVGLGKMGGILSEIKSGILVIGMGLNTVAHPENNLEYPTLDLKQLKAWNDEDGENNKGLPSGEFQTAQIAATTAETFDETFRQWLKDPESIQKKVSSDLWKDFMSPLANLNLIHLESQRPLQAKGLDSTGALKCLYKDTLEETLVIEGEVALVL